MSRVIIGVDPHKLSATIEVLDHQEQVLATGRFGTDRDGYRQMTGGVLLTLGGCSGWPRSGSAAPTGAPSPPPCCSIGAGQGLAFAPMTSAGIAGVDARNAGAASGTVNTFHQVGMALGLGVLVAASAHAGVDRTGAVALTDRVDAALTTGSVLLLAGRLVVIALIVPVEARER